jgi:hypothetical protein
MEIGQNRQRFHVHRDPSLDQLLRRLWRDHAVSLSTSESLARILLAVHPFGSAVLRGVQPDHVANTRPSFDPIHPLPLQVFALEPQSPTAIHLDTDIPSSFHDLQYCPDATSWHMGRSQAEARRRLDPSRTTGQRSRNGFGAHFPE